MRVGDFSVQVVAVDGDVRELESGHVLARPGQVYRLRLRNHGPLRCVADVSIDGHPITGGGLVIDAWSTVELERPIHATERGRFTVIAEGDERVFGSDGGRDNPDLGLIEARFRRELPRREQPTVPPAIPRPIVATPLPPGYTPGYPPAHSPTQPAPGRRPSRWPSPPEWTPPTWQGVSARSREPLGGDNADGFPSRIRALISAPVHVELPAAPPRVPDAIERAAGTGLTGSSTQEFVPADVGALESEATVIRLRLVIGSEEALAETRPLPEQEEAPARPAARP